MAARRILSSAIPALLAIFGLHDAQEARAEPAVTTVGLTAGQDAIVEWAIGLFDEAGLELPPIAVVRHDSTGPCFGRLGAHLAQDGRSTVHICTEESGPGEDFLFLHEIAHAWERHSVSDDRRETFLRLRGLREWRNDDPDRWHDRGAEHAAEIMVWGLMDRPVRIVRLERNGCTEMRAGYVALTGQDPLHGYTEKC